MSQRQGRSPVLQILINVDGTRKYIGGKRQREVEREKGVNIFFVRPAPPLPSPPPLFLLSATFSLVSLLAVNNPSLSLPSPTLNTYLFYDVACLLGVLRLPVRRIHTSSIFTSLPLCLSSFFHRYPPPPPLYLSVSLSLTLPQYISASHIRFLSSLPPPFFTNTQLFPKIVLHPLSPAGSSRVKKQPQQRRCY